MSVTEELRGIGVVSKAIDNEVDPNKPTYWSRHAWRFDDDNDGIVRLSMAKLQQNGREILYGNMTLDAIDALAGVPAFHPGITNEEAAKLALARERFTTYQRALIWERIEGIQAAWREAGFAHTGSITLHVPPEHIESGAVTAHDEGDGRVVVEMRMKDILLQVDDGYVDVETRTGRDFRPLHVIDGQHRKVSCELDLFLQGFNVFVNILPLGSTYAEAAQLFTELNVTAEPLKPLHQLFQRYSCFIPHREAAKDYGNPDDPEIDPTRARHRRANRRAFELAMRLASEHRSPLYQRVQTMELPNRQLARGCAVTSKKFVEFARSWFLSDRLFQGMPDDEVYTTFVAYLRAWKQVANTDDEDEYTDAEGWDLNHERGVADPYITRMLPFESVLMLFPLVHGYSHQYEGSLREKYLTTLTPLLPVDFTDYGALHAAYGLNQETPKDLFAWFSWAISNYVQTGQTYPVEQVWNPNTRERELCKPGRGFFSPPDRNTIEGVFEWDSDGLHIGNNLSVWMRPYPNIHRQPLVSVKYLDRNGNVLGSSTNYATGATHHGHALYKHTLGPAFANATELQVQLVIYRLHEEAQVQTAGVIIKHLRNSSQNFVEFGSRHQVPEAWLAIHQATPTEPTEADSNTNQAPAVPEPAQPTLTVVKVDDAYIMPPPKANTVHEPVYGPPIVPQISRLVQCPVAASGMDCSNPTCVCKSVSGYSWL
jgi:hypothetical protein